MLKEGSDGNAGRFMLGSGSVGIGGSGGNGNPMSIENDGNAGSVGRLMPGSGSVGIGIAKLQRLTPCYQQIHPSP